ncbi:phage tail protein, partial [Escherichia coli]|uniref:phage tail protein n=1 Tax=Escherichia coli TaxID=562 RepID=UPI00207CFD69
GVPVPWPSATPPTGWLKCNGAAFSAEEYPELAKAYPTNKLPDLRGEFIRGWDDGRGVDTGRGLVTWQDWAQMNIHGSLSGVAILVNGQGTGAIKINTSSNSSKWSTGTPEIGLIRDITFDTSKVEGMKVA